MSGPLETSLTTTGQILGLGTPELIIILVVLLLLFGAKKLPELAKSIGNSAKELRKGMTDDPSAGNESEDSKSDAKRVATHTK